ncbi:fumarate reductase/succinate dehydrogenase flavoprotein subunit [Vampirovibrio chlorellavorus]|uniref:fumarate reductase/succinate dehydrogenase flavoprotein subunit n=1 Tax=Vampirovibrio chlorellavorus TaxID=758823 RepID=UPI0026EBDD47|nr:fumarate reductase/succinate dehydrogenase flavoprotein subunit [Vampirovibrio chlorellavorus]
MSVTYETHTHDVLVIGAGGAGLRAAIEVSAQGLSVGLVCKSLLGKAHTVMAEGGAAAALGNVDPQDGWQTHFKDTMKGGKFMNNWRMAELHAKQAPDRINELQQWGAVFDRTKDGKISQRAFGGHTYKRLAHVGDRTGLEMIRTLQDKGVHSGIDVYMECTVSQLLKDGDGRVNGAFGYWRESGRFVVFNAKAVILATGGTGKAWKITSNSWEYTGDGQTLAYDAGADLLDMEFIQFHPTGMVWPPGVRGILVTEGVRGEGGILRNKDGKRFMFDYLPPETKHTFAETEEECERWVKATLANEQTDARRPPELSTRDNVAKAIYYEVQAGRGSPHGGVFLDISYQDADRIKRKLPSMYHQFKELADVDITKQPMEVGPTMHYTMGGIRVNPETQMTAVPGLFAAGECAAGLHGANRLGGNSLSDLVVFGRLAGLGAVEFAKSVEGTPKADEAQVKAAAQELLAPFERTGEGPYEVHRDLQEVMQHKVGIMRTEEDLQKALVELDAIEQRVAKVSVEGSIQFNPGWHLAQDLKNMIVVSKAVAKCALERRESRGGHTRVDFPNYDEKLANVNALIRKGEDGSMQYRTEATPEMPPELKKLFEEEKK